MSVLALDIGGSHVGYAVVDKGVVLCSSSIQTDRQSLQELLPDIAHQLREKCRSVGIRPGTCEGIAVGFPAIVDSRSGEVLSTLGSKFADVTGIQLRKWAMTEFGLPLRIENDARLALLGERSAGAARGFDDVVMVTLGTGIGVAVMLERRLLHSYLGQAGAIGGHMIVRFDGRQCVCGARGCAEAEASTSVLPVLCQGWPEFSGSSLAQEQRLNFETVFQALDAGDVVAAEVIEHCVAIWSALTVTLVHAYGPQLILFGGGVAQRGERLLRPLRDAVHRQSWKTSRGETMIENSMLGADAAFIGAEALMREELV